MMFIMMEFIIKIHNKSIRKLLSKFSQTQGMLLKKSNSYIWKVASSSDSQQSSTKVLNQQRTVTNKELNSLKKSCKTSIINIKSQMYTSNPWTLFVKVGSTNT